MANILLIESEDGPRRSLRNILEQEGHNVTSATRVSEAYALYPQWRWDLIISDVFENSFETMFSGIPVINVPTGATSIEGLLPPSFGRTTKLPKPFHRGEFVAAVQAQLSITDRPMM